MSETLAFLAWQRSGVYQLVTAPPGRVPRLGGTVPLQLRDRDPQGNLGPAVNDEACFEIMGPGDVTALNRTAVNRIHPPHYAANVETTKCVQIELAAADLPWRYTPQITDNSVLQPWIVLVVGTLTEGDIPGEIEILPGNQIRLAPTVTQDLPLNQSARWAHVQIELANKVADPNILTTEQIQALIDAEGGAPRSRLICPRALKPNALHLAAIVPAFNPDGTDRWAAGDSPTVPFYYHWRFRSGPAGDFRTLAAKLRTGLPDDQMGQSRLTYDRVDPEEDLIVRGAIAPISSTDTDLPVVVRDNMAELIDPAPPDDKDERGRWVLIPPEYGKSWVDEPRDLPWGAAANEDPRHRGSAGLGASTAITLQEMIIDTVKEQSGAIGVAAQRIRQLTMGLVAAKSLWDNRLPQDPLRRLQLYGPSMRRIVSPNGTVRDQVTGRGRPLPSALFSSAGRRLLRSGPARTKFAAAQAADARTVIARANQCPPPPPEKPDGQPHIDIFTEKFGFPSFSALQEEILNGRPFDPDMLFALFLETVAQAPPEVQDLIDQFQFIQMLENKINNGEPFDYGALAELIGEIGAREPDLDKIALLLEQFRVEETDEESLLGFLDVSFTKESDRPCDPVDLVRLEEILTAAIDPTGPNAWMTVRVLRNIDGLIEPVLAPVEFCTGVDMPTWRNLRDTFPEWLLPGIGQLKENTIYPFESNPTFVDSFLLGLNTQTLNELRWRNMPIATGCTPLKMFWGRIDADGTERLNDIRDVGNWDTLSTLGDADHQPAGVGSENLVLVFKSDLFHRYPDTIFSAIEAKKDVNGDPLFDEDDPDNLPNQDSPRRWPVFQGSIGEDVTFFGFDLTPAEANAFWFVLEEPPPGYRFYSDDPANNDILPATPADDGGRFAKQRLHDPTRVLIKGDEFIPE